MKQYKLMQVALLAILLFGWVGCSQNEEEVPGNVRNGIVLNVTDTGIISNEPSTRTEDTGFVTTFTQGDQIGLFAVKDGAILDEINNMPFTFNGSSWSGKPILYDDRLVGVNFYAYTLMASSDSATQINFFTKILYSLQALPISPD